MYEREYFNHPQKNLLQAGLSVGAKVGEFGCGSGHVAMACAGIVGSEGRVYAVDIQEDVLTHLRDTLERQQIRNVDTIWGDIEKEGGARLRESVLDAVILSNVLFQISDREAVRREVERVLRPGGKVLVTDWAGSYNGMGPHSKHIVSEYEAEELFIGGGFHKVKSYRAGPYHYSILFTRPGVE
jgi:ubiquinone/menaquinone biosynthesis C-methylase UbiE